MSWIPGWQSAASAEWWSSFYFWVGIGFLILLAGSEVASHVYSLRKDELAAAAERQAATVRDAEQKRQQEAHQAELDAAVTKAAQAQKEVEKLRAVAAPRVLTAEQQSILMEAARPFAGQKFQMFSPMGDWEARQFGMEIVSALETAGWDHNGANGIAQAVTSGPTEPVEIRLNPVDVQERTFPVALGPLTHAFVQAGLLGLPAVMPDQVVPRGYIQVQIGRKAAPP